MTTATDLPPSSTGRRIPGLDAWRSVLMLGGLLLHATMGMEDFAPFAAINIVSGSFRMGAFFMIAGLLSGQTLSRRPAAGPWAKRRIYMLAVPTAFTVIVVMPLAAIVDGVPWRDIKGGLFHMWFMVTLIGYTLMAWAIDGWLRRRRTDRARQGTTPPSQTMMLIGVGALSFVLMMAMLRLAGLYSPAFLGYARQLPLAVGYAPIFLLGFAAARTPDLLARLTGRMRQPIAILAGMAIAHLLWRSPWRPAMDAVMADSIDTILLTAAAAFCPPAAAAIIMRSAATIRQVPMVLQRLCSASLTMYVLHYPVMSAAHGLIVRNQWGPWPTWTAVLAIGSIVPYAVHVLLVERIPIAAFLLNGRPIEPAPVTGPVGAPVPDPAPDDTAILPEDQVVAGT